MQSRDLSKLPDNEDLFEKPCRAFPTKKRYGTKASAQAMILRRGNEARVRTYRCKSCQGWHLASIVID